MRIRMDNIGIKYSEEKDMNGRMDTQQIDELPRLNGFNLLDNKRGSMFSNEQREEYQKGFDKLGCFVVGQSTKDQTKDVLQIG